MYGLGVHSAIPLWVPEVEDCPEDVRVLWQSGTIAPCDQPGQYISEIDADGIRIYWPGIARMSIRDGREISIETVDGEELNHPCHLISGLGMGLILHQRGTFTLHASTVAVGQGAVAVAGAKHSGKSTTAAALSARGHTLLSDDVLALDSSSIGALNVLPGPSTLNLWPDTAMAVGHDPARLPKISQRSTKRVSRLEIDGSREGIPLKAIYFLEVSGEVQEPTIERYPPSEGMSLLIGNSHALRFVEDKDAMPRHLRQCARVAKNVGLFHLKRPEGLDSIQGVARLIEDHVESWSVAGMVGG